jgi:hypothetical protein
MRSDLGVSTGLISQGYWENSKWYFVNVERGNIADKSQPRNINVSVNTSSNVAIDILIFTSGQDSVQTHRVFFIHVSTLLDQVHNHLRDRTKERMLGSAFAQHCLDIVVLGQVESGIAVLKRARGVSGHMDLFVGKKKSVTRMGACQIIQCV